MGGEGGGTLMAYNFVLVHGAWHGGWCWRRVADRLRAGGHLVFTPTLTGLGERAHLLRAGIGLATHITDVVNVFTWEGLSDVVLCGHSYGGFIISGVADAVTPAPRRGPPRRSGSIRPIAPGSTGCACRSRSRPSRMRSHSPAAASASR